MKEMRTLNGYEIVDKKAREDILVECNLSICSTV